MAVMLWQRFEYYYYYYYHYYSYYIIIIIVIIIITIIIIASEASFLVCSMRGFSIYIYVYIFQAVRRAVNVLNVSTCI